MPLYILGNIQFIFKENFMENTIIERTRQPFSVEVKSSIINALENGKSVLLKDREGISYPQNAKTATVYEGVNLLHLQQFKEDRNLNSNYFLTKLQINDLSMGIKGGSLGALISYFNPKGKYENDVTNKEGVVIHKKGDPKTDEYKYVYNLDNVDPRLRKFDPVSKKMVITSNVFSIKDENKQQVPYDTTKKGMFYKANDESVIEKFTSDVSRYMNSLYTGEKYTASTYNKKEIADLKTEFLKPYSKFFINIDKAFYVATGKMDKFERLINNVDKKQAQLVASQKQEYKKKKSR